MFGVLVIIDVCQYTYWYIKYQKLTFKDAIKQAINEYIGTQY